MLTELSSLPKAFAELVSKLVSVLGLKGMPTLPAVERPYQDWEVQVAWAFDPNLEAACPEWAQARDLSIFFQMLLSSVPALSQSLEGQGVAPAGDAALSASSMAECGFSLSLFNPPSKLTVKVLHLCTIAARHANFLYTQPSLAHPKVLCPSLPYLRFGGSLENEIASTPHLPDFDFSLTQAQAETLLMILNCPGPLGLQFPAVCSPRCCLPGSASRCFSSSWSRITWPFCTTASSRGSSSPASSSPASSPRSLGKRKRPFLPRSKACARPPAGSLEGL